MTQSREGRKARSVDSPDASKGRSALAQGCFAGVDLVQGHHRGIDLVRGHPVGIMGLDQFCARFPKLALAFSGGLDSSYLLSVLHDAGLEVKAYSLRTALQYPFESDDARRLAGELGAEYEEIEADVLAQEDICANLPNRCYRCKRFMFEKIIEHMKQDGFEVLVDGTNASDNPARRPGFKAMSELQVLSPLRLAGLDKEAIRAASKLRGLFTWDKASYSCLATKVETGIPLTRERLARVLLEEETSQVASCGESSARESA